jgi:hypothetical protein
MGECRKMHSGENPLKCRSQWCKKDVDVVAYIKPRRLEWTGNTCGLDEWITNAKENLGRISGSRLVGKAKG